MLGYSGLQLDGVDPQRDVRRRRARLTPTTTAWLARRVATARMSFSYRPDIAKVIAHVLTTREHEENIYNVTTPESVSLSEPRGDRDRSDRQAASLRAGRRGRVGGEVASHRPDGLVPSKAGLRPPTQRSEQASSTSSRTTTAG